MATEFSTGKSIFVLGIVAGCFAILWPNIFYPMLTGNYGEKDVIAPTQGSGCCDVIFDTDVNAIKVMTELCEKILSSESNYIKDYALHLQQGKLTKAIVNKCQQAVLDKCGVDITEFLMDKVRLGRDYKQILDEIRSLNSSICLKQNFGVSFGPIGLPRVIRIWGLNKPKHLRQERPPHLRPDFMHPALREKGRAIPQSHIVPKVTYKEGRPGPLPGIRPPMGGAGHVVPAPKTGGTMGIVMPMYTIGIVVFFLYTMMKLIFKKSETANSYESFTPDPEFHRSVFNDCGNKSYLNGKETFEDTKLGWKERDTIVSAISGLVEEVNRQIRSDQEAQLSKEKNSNEIEASVETVEPLILDDDESVENDGKGIVKVMGMEMTESCEKGAKWSRPATPLSRPPTPQNIYIPTAVPSQTQLLVSESHTEETRPTDDHGVVLTGKVTLSLIGLEADNEEDEPSPQQDENVESASDTGKEAMSSVNGPQKLEDDSSRVEVGEEEVSTETESNNKNTFPHFDVTADAETENEENGQEVDEERGEEQEEEDDVIEVEDEEVEEQENEPNEEIEYESEEEEEDEKVERILDNISN